MRVKDYIQTQSPIGRYFAVASIFVVIAAIVKFITLEPNIETRTVVINERTYAYQVREGEEQDTLTHMVKTYGNMVVADTMNKQCTYLTPLDTDTLNDNTKMFGAVVDEIIKENATLKQHIIDVRYQNLNAQYECGAQGRAAVEHYTHASRAIVAGLNIAK